MRGLFLPGSNPSAAPSGLAFVSRGLLVTHGHRAGCVIPHARSAEEIAESSLLRQVPGGGASWTRLARAALRPSAGGEVKDFSLAKAGHLPLFLLLAMMMMLIEVAHQRASLETEVSSRQERNGEREQWDLLSLSIPFLSRMN